ncbi:unnamed protein product [Blepharisma stoltei]|uniref:Transmembrane protein n=1 Tax=Blepharisma stoltei TaxID=1481888 RepID=A0AAU9IM21_9CILI|nr:unnamed protein product [Blepharisma stoltei]
MSADQRKDYYEQALIQCFSMAYSSKYIIQNNDQLDLDYDKMLKNAWYKIYGILFGASVGIYYLDRYIKQRHQKYITFKRFTAFGLGLSASWIVISKAVRSQSDSELTMKIAKRYEDQLQSLYPELRTLYDQTFAQPLPIIPGNPLWGQPSSGQSGQFNGAFFPQGAGMPGFPNQGGQNRFPGPDRKF